jgi:iron-sulfur cluster assembly accessory protein
MLTITEAATRKLNEVLAQQTQSGGPVYGLRISAAPGCCSGAQYGLSLAQGLEEGDWEGTFGDVRVLVDADSAPFLQGVAVDYVETPDGAGFTIRNPNATEQPQGGGCGSGGCSCG